MGLKIGMLKGQRVSVGYIDIVCASGYATINIDAPKDMSIVRHFEYSTGDDKALEKANKLTPAQQNTRSAQNAAGGKK